MVYFLGPGSSPTRGGTLGRSLNLHGLLLSHLPQGKVGLDWEHRID